ncbi:MAG: hypothetical protein IJM63_11840 [Solobacterium sp.]|nr:hypothetical protein [Solobacterium sp.]MBQ9825184.1 hypothetical protein [Solobacterium sp.]
MPNTYTVEIHADVKTEILLDEAWNLARKLPENRQYLDQPWFTREYQLTLAINGSASSAHDKIMNDTWVNEALMDHIADMEKILDQ